MRFRVVYTIGSELRRGTIEGAGIKEALQRGARELRWESVLEILAEDGGSIQGKV